jgi:hypothetical protein
MTVLWLGHFVHEMAFHYGLGGWALLARVGLAVLLVAIGVLLLVLKIVSGAVALVRLSGTAFVDGWRKAGTRD